MSKTFSAPPPNLFFLGVKLNLPPSSRFVASPPPLPVISDQSLRITIQGAVLS